jgi:hypothetical protein
MYRDTLILPETIIHGTAKEYELRNKLLNAKPVEPISNPATSIISKEKPLKNPVCNQPLNSPISFLYDNLYKPMEKRKIKKRSNDGRMPIPMAK